MRSREVRVVVLDLFTLALPLMGKHCLDVRPYVESLHVCMSEYDTCMWPYVESLHVCMSEYDTCLWCNCGHVIPTFIIKCTVQK
jgi:hypothetical protein